MRTIQDMVQQEIMSCMSSLVSTLAGAAFRGNSSKELDDLCEQAAELAAPIPDYEEAAVQAGWTRDDKADGYTSSEDPHTTYENMTWCEHEDIEPYDREVFEHWAISPWLAEKLIATGERVDTDFAGLNVWARTTTGQAIHADGVIERIYANMMQPEKA